MESSDKSRFNSLAERIRFYLSQSPEVHPTAFVHPSAVVIGAVKIAAQASIWPGVVIRADLNTIDIGPGSNIQDGTIIHLSNEQGVVVGTDVTVGHGCVIHACTLHDGALIGMRATILDGAVIGAESIVGANALVTKGIQVPEGSLVLGSPARVVRSLTQEERAANRALAKKYQETAEIYREYS